MRTAFKLGGIMVLTLLLVACASSTALSRAEQTHQIAFATVDSFLYTEHTDRALFEIAAPGVHAFAEKMRKQAPAAFEASWKAIEAWEAAKNDQGITATAQIYLAVVQSLADSVRPYLLRWAIAQKEVTP